MNAKHEEQRRRMTLWILRASIGLAVLFILVGLELFAFRGGAYFPRSPSGSLLEIAADAWRGMLNLRPSAYFDAGILVILLTPLVRLLSGVIANARTRDWVYVAIGLMVITLVAVGLFAGQA
jgi:uncharacterized membrane protein